MNKMYAATERFMSGHETFFNYFPTVEAAQKMFDGEKADCASRGVKIEMILEEIPLPAKLEVFDRYEVGDVYSKDDYMILSSYSDSWKWDVFANANVIDFWYDETQMFIVINPSNYNESIVVGNINRVVELIKETPSKVELASWDDDSKEIIKHGDITESIQRLIEREEFFKSHPIFKNHY